jgi:hypothetical protein
MTIKNVCFNWNYGEQPYWEGINLALSAFTFPVIVEVEPYSDAYAIVIIEKQDVSSAQLVYDEYMSGVLEE